MSDLFSDRDGFYLLDNFVSRQNKDQMYQININRGLVDTF
ncbi:hypothetical protein SynBIOSE41_00051 [Synechococcus sp. BIOS-E4-1]|nr:hypothetical protein SynBIOSE41_00051 [Synechococcus sp. BIOS-E4-1]